MIKDGILFSPYESQATLPSPASGQQDDRQLVMNSVRNWVPPGHLSAQSSSKRDRMTVGIALKTGFQHGRVGKKYLRN